jgi:hypothetical protein
VDSRRSASGLEGNLGPSSRTDRVDDRARCPAGRFRAGFAQRPLCKGPLGAEEFGMTIPGSFKGFRQLVELGDDFAAFPKFMVVRGSPIDVAGIQENAGTRSQ